MKIIEITESLGPIAPKLSSGKFCPHKYYFQDQCLVRIQTVPKHELKTEL